MGKTYDVADLGDYLEAHVAEFIPNLLREKMFRAFLAEITRRSMTREGRFIRVHFKSGAKVDLVPQESLARGWQSVHDGRRRAGWRLVSPRLDRLWRDFKTHYRKNGNEKPGRKGRTWQKTIGLEE